MTAPLVLSAEVDQLVAAVLSDAMKPLSDVMAPTEVTARSQSADVLPVLIVMPPAGSSDTLTCS